MARRKRIEEESRHEAWAISYGDLVTLLMAFFVVMYATSTVNQGKYRVLSRSIAAAFRGTPRADELPIGGSARTVLPLASLPLTEIRRAIDLQLPGRALPLRHLPESIAPPAAHPAAALPAGAEPGGQTATLNRVAAEVHRAMAGLIAAGRLHVLRTPGSVVVDISTDILFPSGVAQLSDSAQAALQHLAAVLAPLPYSMRVEGNTDNRPIRTREFPSNWALSAARAASVVRLFMAHGIAPRRMAVVGYGQYRPVMPNTTAAGRNANRRVEVVILGPVGPAQASF